MRVLCWFSCGASSAVAAKVASELYGDELEILYCDTSRDEHEDNARFIQDVEKWIGRPVRKLIGKYKTIEEVFEGESYIVGVIGAACTKMMKRKVREAYRRNQMKELRDMTEPELGMLMRSCAKAISSQLSQACGTAKPMFALVVFDDPEIAQYISSCERESMIKAMRETADRLERKQDLKRN